MENFQQKPQKQMPAPAKAAVKSTLASRATGARSKTATPSATPNTKSAASIAAAQKREAQRKQLLEMKRKQKLAMTTNASTPPADDIIASPANGETNHTNETER